MLSRLHELMTSRRTELTHDVGGSGSRFPCKQLFSIHNYIGVWAIVGLYEAPDSGDAGVQNWETVQQRSYECLNTVSYSIASKIS